MERSHAQRDSIEIRRLGGDDAADYRRLMLDGYRLHADAFTATVDERGGLPLAWWSSRIEREFVIGARCDGALVGVAGLAAETRPKTRHKATLYGMHVDVAHAGRGIGRRLVAAVLDEASAQKTLRVVQLTVTDGNRAAQALYARCGFVVFGIEPFAITTATGHAAKVHMWIDLESRRMATVASSEASHA